MPGPPPFAIPKMYPRSGFRSWGNMRTYPRSGFRFGGTSECTLVPAFVPGEHPPKPPFWKTTLLSTRETSLKLRNLQQHCVARQGSQHVCVCVCVPLPKGPSRTKNSTESEFRYGEKLRYGRSKTLRRGLRNA